MKQLTSILEGHSVIRQAIRLASTRKAAAEAATLADKVAPNNETAYKLLKFDNFDKDAYLANSFDIPRNKMPQIPDDELDRILIHFMNKHGGAKKEIVPIAKLQPTQNEIDMDKVRDMIKKDDGHWRKRIYIVSKDFRLCDGHHSHVYGMIDDPTAEVTIYRSKLPIDRMLNILRRLKITTIEQ
jgi:hypothetical protein